MEGGVKVPGILLVVPGFPHIGSSRIFVGGSLPEGCTIAHIQRNNPAVKGPNISQPHVPRMRHPGGAGYKLVISSGKSSGVMRDNAAQ